MSSYNNDFAWPHGFGGGLAPAGTCGNPFAGLDPSSDAFEDATRTLQAEQGLKVDGAFGPATFEAYKSVHGAPSLETYGIDVSRWEPPRKLDYPGLYNAGFTWNSVKVQDHERETPYPYATENCQVTIDCGMELGKYLFLRPMYDPQRATRQVELFLRAMERTPGGLGQILPCLDFESKGYSVDKKSGEVIYGHDMLDLYRTNREEYVDRMTAFHVLAVERLARAIDEDPLIYSYPSFLRKRVRPEPELTACKLWLAIYHEGDPARYERHRVPEGYTLDAQQTGSDGNERSNDHATTGLDVNRTPWGTDRIKRTR